MDPRLVENPTFLRYYERWQNDPKSVVFAAISEIFRGYGMIDEAIKVAEKGLVYHPNLVSGRVALGKAYLAAGDFSRAREEALRIITLAPNNPEALAIIEALKEFETPAAPHVEEKVEVTIPLSMRQAFSDSDTQNQSDQNTTFADSEEDITEEMPLSAIDTKDDETIAEDIVPVKKIDEPTIEEPSPSPVVAAAASIVDDLDETYDVEEKVEDEDDVEEESCAAASDDGDVDSDEDRSEAPAKDKASLNPAWQTITMARILASQGHAGQAKKIYRSILARDPKNEAARLELSKL